MIFELSHGLGPNLVATVPQAIGGTIHCTKNLLVVNHRDLVMCQHGGWDVSAEHAVKMLEGMGVEVNAESIDKNVPLAMRNKVLFPCR